MKWVTSILGILSLFFVAFVSLTIFEACTKPSPTNPAPNPPVLNAITTAACNAQNTVIGLEATATATLFKCSSPDVIQADMQTFLGNANFCSYVNQSTANAKALFAFSQKAKKPMLSLRTGKPLLTEGGAIADALCPLVCGALVVYATNQIPTRWNCQISADAAQYTAACSTACEVAPF